MCVSFCELFGISLLLMSSETQRDEFVRHRERCPFDSECPAWEVIDFISESVGLCCYSVCRSLLLVPVKERTDLLCCICSMDRFRDELPNLHTW